MIRKNTQYGLKTIGGTNGVRFCVSYAGSCLDGWKDFYENKPPWKKWFNNPIFHNRSGYDEMLGEYRIWFIFMWHIIQY